MLIKNMPSSITKSGTQPGGKVCLIVVCPYFFYRKRLLNSFVRSMAFHLHLQ